MKNEMNGLEKWARLEQIEKETVGCHQSNPLLLPISNSCSTWEYRNPFSREQLLTYQSIYPLRETERNIVNDMQRIP